ncbi:MAG: hypothetical protein AB7F96_16545 [Beijerinckiaceae bacterium]
MSNLFAPRGTNFTQLLTVFGALAGGMVSHKQQHRMAGPDLLAALVKDSGLLDPHIGPTAPEDTELLWYKTVLSAATENGQPGSWYIFAGGNWVPMSQDLFIAWICAKCGGAVPEGPGVTISGGVRVIAAAGINLKTWPTAPPTYKLPYPIEYNAAKMHMLIVNINTTITITYPPPNETSSEDQRDFATSYTDFGLFAPNTNFANIVTTNPYHAYQNPIWFEFDTALAGLPTGGGGWGG